MRGVRQAAVILFMVSAFGCGKKVEPTVQAPPVRVQGVTVTAVATEPIPELQEAVGTVKAKASAVISARLAGTVTGVFVREGDRVVKGKTVATIDAAESGAAAAGAVSGVEEAARALEEARSRRRLADATFERYRRLYSEQAVTRQEFEVRQSEQEVAREGVARSEARLKQAKETSKAASVVAGYGNVTSPLSGTVIAKQVETGQTVFPGTPIATIEGDGGFRLEVAAPETLLGKIKQGDQVGVELEGAPATGRVAEIVPLVDAASRTFIVKVDLPSKGLKSGRYGKVRFQAGAQPGIAVPSGAIVERGALTSVWAVSKDGIARLRLVKVGRKVEDRVEIISGLTPGDRIVTAGMEKVTDGVKVE
jgi:RND family efflux transporter MFP subunit